MKSNNKVLCAFVHRHKKTGKITSIEYQELTVHNTGFIYHKVKGILYAYETYPNYMFLDQKKNCYCLAYYDTEVLPIPPSIFFEIKKEFDKEEI